MVVLLLDVKPSQQFVVDKGMADKQEQQGRWHDNGITT
jgi:hypothetical protein